MTNPRALRCKHKFCSNCIQTALGVNNKCPVCQEPQGVLRGNQPPGKMTVHYDHYKRVPGYTGNLSPTDFPLKLNGGKLERAPGVIASLVEAKASTSSSRIKAYSTYSVNKVYRTI